MAAGEQEAPRRRQVLLIAAAGFLVLVLFGITRGVAFHQVGESVYGRHARLDAAFYFDQATRIAGGELQTDQAFYFGPGWPHLLGLAFSVFEAEIATGRALNVFLSLLTLVLIAAAGWRAAGIAAGLGGAAFWALYRPAIFYEQTLLLETAAATCVAAWAAAWLWLVPQRNARERITLTRAAVVGAALGVLVGLCGLMRSNLLVLGPVGVVGILAVLLPRWKPALACCAAMTLAALLMIAPATLHNWRAESEFIPISSNLGINLWVGLGPEATGAYVPPPTTRGNQDLRGMHLARLEPGREDVSSKELSAFWRERALEELSLARLTHLSFSKFVLFFRGEEIPQIYHLGVMREDLGFLRWPLPGWGVLVVLWVPALVVLAAARRRNAPLMTVAAAGVLISLTLLPFFVTGRYRLPAVPLMIIPAAAAVREACRLWPVLPVKVRSLWAAGLCALALVVFGMGRIEPFPMEPGRIAFENMRAQFYAEDGQPARALEIISAANTELPQPLGLATEAALRMELQGDAQAAAALYDRALQSEGLSAMLYFNAAQAYLMTGQEAKGREALERSVALDPNLAPEAWFNLGLLRLQAVEVPAAEDAFRNALRLRPGWTQAEEFLARLEAARTPQ